MKKIPLPVSAAAILAAAFSGLGIARQCHADDEVWSPKELSLTGLAAPVQYLLDNPTPPTTAPLNSSGNGPVVSVPAGAEIVPASPESPKKLLQWEADDIQYLFGFNWRAGSTPAQAPHAERDIITFEHADGWKYGDNYLFIDVNNITQQTDGTSFYGEFQPRFSYAKISGQKVEIGPIQDIEQSNRIVMTDNFFAHMHGVSVDLKVPGFLFLYQNFWIRKEEYSSGITWQLHTEWEYPFFIDKYRFVCDGFFDVIGPMGHEHWNINSQPQLLWDFGKCFGYDDQLFFGVEFDCRVHEYGNPHQFEFVPQVMVEAKF